MTPTMQQRQLLDELLSKGIRLTSPRRAVVSVIQEANSHLKRLRPIDELDLMHLEGKKHYYEVKTEGDHIHLACFDCGMIQEFTSPLFDRLKEEVARNTCFEIRVARLELGGFCRGCSSRRHGEEKPILQLS